MNIMEEIGQNALWRQAAEEATELAHALLKLDRATSDINPTPVTLEEARDHVREEWSDLCLVMNEANIQSDRRIMFEKRERWIERIEKGGDAT